MLLLQLVIGEVAQGCIYGLIALGFVLIYKATETVSFAQGDLMMLGAFCGFALMATCGWPFWAAAIVAIVLMSLLGGFVKRLVFRPVLGQPAFTIAMLTIGIGYIARGLITMIPGVGTETHLLAVPYKDQLFQAGSLVLSAEQLATIAATTVLCAILFALFCYTRIGIAMQAASQNQLAAHYMGIPVRMLNGVVLGGGRRGRGDRGDRRPYPQARGQGDGQPEHSGGHVR